MKTSLVTAICIIILIIYLLTILQLFYLVWTDQLRPAGSAIALGILTFYIISVSGCLFIIFTILNLFKIQLYEFEVKSVIITGLVIGFFNLYGSYLSLITRGKKGFNILYLFMYPLECLEKKLIIKNYHNNLPDRIL